MSRSIRKFVPPVIYDIKNKLTGKKETTYFKGDYAAWKLAVKDSTGYDSEVILEKCKTALLKVKNGEAAYERDSVLFDSIQYSWGLLAGLAKAAIENDSRLCVTDFGGSLGSSYFQNKGFLAGLKKLDWCIIEQKHFVDCGIKFFATEQLHFYYSIKECLNEMNSNVLLLSGVLQYLENPYELLDELLAIGFPYIILTRLATCNLDRDVLTVQTVSEKIYKASYPAWFFSAGKIQKMFEERYVEIGRFEDGFTASTLVNRSLQVQWQGYIYRKCANE